MLMSACVIDQEFTLAIGEEREFYVTVYETDETDAIPLDLDGYTVIFAASPEEGTEATILKSTAVPAEGAQITPTTTGRVVFYFVADDTPEATTLAFEIWLVGNGVDERISRGGTLNVTGRIRPA